MIEMLLLLSFENHFRVVSLVRKLDINHGRRTFLYFHLVKEIVTFYSRGHGHDFVGHESASPSGASC